MMRVAMVTSWNEACGIAEYAQGLVSALAPLADVRVVPIERRQTRPDYFRRLAEACRGADLVHVQHEYVFFGGRDPWNCRWPDFIAALKEPWVATAHTWLRPFAGGPLWKRAFRAARAGYYRFLGWERYLQAGQFSRARKVVVHSRAFRDALVSRGLAPEAVLHCFQPVPAAVPAGRRRPASAGVCRGKRWSPCSASSFPPKAICWPWKPGARRRPTRSW